MALRLGLFCGCLIFGVMSHPHDLFAQEIDNRNLLPEEVLVLANRASKDSLDVAAYYMKQRKIPAANLFTIDIPVTAHPFTISQSTFQDKIVTPLKAFLAAKNRKTKILCLVSVTDFPYNVAGPMITADEKKTIGANIRREIKKRKLNLPEKQLATIIKQNTGLGRASVDSELAWLYRKDLYRHPAKSLERRRRFCFWARNPYQGAPFKVRHFRQLMQTNKNAQGVGLFYLTARLEGPTVAIAKGLVDKAMQAERDGVSGQGYFDAKGMSFGKRKIGYEIGDYWARHAWIETKNAGFKATFERTKKLFGKDECPDALMYWGWYALQGFRDSFKRKFAPGAIAVHMASGEATNIRKASNEGGPWCAGFLTQGVTVTVGPMGEPYLSAFPHTDLFYQRLYSGWSVGESYWAAIAHTSWRMVLIGDPLYTPFGGKHALKKYVTGGFLLLHPGNKKPLRGFPENVQIPLLIRLASPHAIFKKENTYTVRSVRGSAPSLKITGQDNVKFTVGGDGKILLGTGITVTASHPGANRNPAIEITLDLAPDGNEHTISQLVRINPTPKPPAAAPKPAPNAPPNKTD